MIKIKRIYEPPAKNDGTRILVDRLWPRALSREKAYIDLWLKEVAPSDHLRKWFSHDPKRWLEFKKRYFKELESLKNQAGLIKDKEKAGIVTLVYGAKNEKYNNAVALKEHLEQNFPQ